MNPDDTSERLKRIEDKLDALEKRGALMGRMYGYEYKSKRMIFGLPLIHIAQGMDPETGKMRIARGIIAIGNVAYGVFALGGIAFGVFAFGGMAIGVCVFGGMAVGLLLGIGGLAVGYIALGGLAVGVYAVGAAAIGIHTADSRHVDEQFGHLLRLLKGISKSKPD